MDTLTKLTERAAALEETCNNQAQGTERKRDDKMTINQRVVVEVSMKKKGSCGILGKSVATIKN